MMRRLSLLALVTCSLALAGCATVPPPTEDNTARWIAHPEFPAAARVAPNLLSEILLTTTRLEAEAARKK